VGDQAQNLRELMRERQGRARVLAVTSGKGGVGKTSASVNLAIALSQLGKRTVLLDADLGLANVEVLLGLNSLHNLQHVISGEMTLGQVIVRGPGGIGVVPGSSGFSQVADLGSGARQRILDGFDMLQREADFIIIDTMAGIGQNAVSFCAAADEILLVVTPEPSSHVDAYAMVKTIHQMRPNAVFRTIVNMAVNDTQGTAVAKKLEGVVRRFLDRPLQYLGTIPRDPHVSHGVMQTQPFLMRYPAAPASKAITSIAERLAAHQAASTAQNDRQAQHHNNFLRRVAQSMGLASNS